MFELTIFKNIKDTSTEIRVSHKDWPEFVSMMYDLSKMPGSKGGPNSTPLISPAVYKKGTTRANKNVEYWGSWACVDIDEYEGSFDELRERFPNFAYLCYSTASSKIEHPRFRLVFPLKVKVLPDKIKPFWFALNKECHGLVDGQTKDTARIFYAPADYPNAYNFIFHHDGEFIDPYLLMKKHPFSSLNKIKSFTDLLPDKVQDSFTSYRRSKLNKEYNWSSYKDCPFFPRDMGIDYMSNAGVKGGGNYFRLYKIMVMTASNAISKGYPLTSRELLQLCRQLDADSGNHYKKRNMEPEVDRAIDYSLKNTTITS